jgi:RNA polymerase sigma-70 factor (ECF subfamily)
MTPHPIEPTDEELMARFQQGEKAAFGELVRRFKDPLTNFVHRMVGDWDDCYDIVQDAFVRAYRSRNTYKPVARLSTWLYSIALNVARTHLRRKKLRRTLGLDRSKDAENEVPIEAIDLDPGPDVIANSAFLKKRIQQALGRLGEKYREVVVLRDIQDLTYEEIAEVTGLNIGTVKSRINRARTFLQEELKDLMEES